MTSGAAKDRVFRFASIYFLFFAALGAFIPWMPVYLRECGFGASWIGLALALGALMRIVASPALGRALDRSPDPRRPLFGFALLAVVSMLVAARADSGVARFVALAVHALVAVPVMPYTEATIQIALADRPDRYGPIRLWGSLGFIATALSTSVLPAWSAPWIVAGCWAGLALLLRWLPRHRQVATHAHRVAWPAALRPLLIAAALATAAHGPYYALFSLQLQARGMSPSAIGSLWCWGVVAEIVLMASAPRWFARVPLASMLSWALVGSCARWLLMAAMPGLFGLLVGQTVHALSFGLSHLAAVRWVAELSPENAKISGQAWLTSASGGYGSAIGLVLAGQLADWDQHKLPYLVAAALAALGWLAARAAVRAAALTAKPRSDRESA